MNTDEKLNYLLDHLKADYEFNHAMSQSDKRDYLEKIIYKHISVILAQAIETVDSDFIRKDYRYEP